MALALLYTDKVKYSKCWLDARELTNRVVDDILVLFCDEAKKSTAAGSQLSLFSQVSESNWTCIILRAVER